MYLICGLYLLLSFSAFSLSFLTIFLPFSSVLASIIFASLILLFPKLENCSFCVNYNIQNLYLSSSFNHVYFPLFRFQHLIFINSFSLSPFPCIIKYFNRTVVLIYLYLLLYFTSCILLNFTCIYTVLSLPISTPIIMSLSCHCNSSFPAWLYPFLIRNFSLFFRCFLSLRLSILFLSDIS